MNRKRGNVKQIIVILVLLIIAGLAIWMVPGSVMSLDNMLNKGEWYQKTGRTALALKIYKKATEMYPADYEAHLHLGNALLEADEPELARHEFDKAVELSGSSKTRSDAQIAMSTMLMADKNFEKAEKVLLSVEDPKPEKVKKKLAEIYVQWGDDKFKENTRKEAIEKYKLAFKNYDSVDVEAQQKVEDKIIRTYNDISNFFLTQKKTDQAIETLNESIAFVDNPTAHIKLAEIYKKQNKRDDSISEYEKAYDLDTTGTAALYLGELLVEKGVELARKNQMNKAKECFEKAQEANPSIIIPAEILYSVSISGIKTALTPNTVADKLYPKVTFKLKNESKAPIKFLKAQAVFIDAGNIVGKSEKIVVNRDKPLPSGKDTKTITLSSSSGVKDIKKSHLIQAKIYLVYEDSPDWKFARTIAISKRKDLFTVKKADKPKTTKTDDKKPDKKPAVALDKPKPQKEVAVEHSFLPDKKPSTTTTTEVSPQPIPVPIPVQVDSNKPSNVELPPITNEFKIE